MQQLMENALNRLGTRIRSARTEVPFVRIVGRVVEASAAGLKVEGLSTFLKPGAHVQVEAVSRRVLGEVIRVDRTAAIIKAFDVGDAIGLGATVSPVGHLTLRPDMSWSGRVIDALGRPIDGGSPLSPGAVAVDVDANPPPAMTRGRVVKPVRTGIKVIDMFTPICSGQRIGIFAGSGVGKSTLLSMLTATSDMDRVVLALVGERGREVREFVEVALKGVMDKTVVVAATGDSSAMMRKQAPLTAMRIAEFFRDAGERVLLIMDSVTRYAHACREVALAAGEPPVTRGYPPSVFAELPHLLERAGPGLEGSGNITGIFAVLVDGDDHNDPIADAIRGTLDGHIVLDRTIAEQGRYPPVNVTASVSRLAQIAWTPEQQTLAVRLRSMIARFEETRDLRSLGGYQPGHDAELDRAVAIVPKLYAALTQSPKDEPSQDVFKDIAKSLAP